MFISMPKLVNKKQNSVVIEGVCTIRHIEKNDKWEVDAGLKLGGTKKHRKRFKSKGGALAHAELLKTKLHNQGMSAFKLTTAQQVDAKQAFKALEETQTECGIISVEQISCFNFACLRKVSPTPFGKLVISFIASY